MTDIVEPHIAEYEQHIERLGAEIARLRAERDAVLGHVIDLRADIAKLREDLRNNGLIR